MSTKICCTCKEIKPTTEFYKDSKRSDGLYPRCKSCHLMCTSKTYIKNKDIVSLRSKERYSVNKIARCQQNREKYHMIIKHQDVTKFPHKSVVCTHCNKTFLKKLKEITRSKSGNVFCSHKCSNIFSTTHKNGGYNRSKLECLLEKELNQMYPNLDILYNNRSTLNYELDIYIPKLNLAFEINGIFHYKPIFGIEKLNKTINKDKIKRELCNIKNIKLIVIDVSEEGICNKDRVLNIINDNIKINQHIPQGNLR